MNNKFNIGNLRLQTNIIRSLIVFLFLSAFSLVSKASHLVGGNITFSHVSGSTYTLRLALYRDCDGIGLGTQQLVQVQGPTGTINVTVNQICVV